MSSWCSGSDGSSNVIKIHFAVDKAAEFYPEQKVEAQMAIGVSTEEAFKGEE